MEYAYVRRIRWEAEVHALALVELVAKLMSGKGVGTLPDGKMYQEVSAKAGLQRMGIEL